MAILPSTPVREPVHAEVAFEHVDAAAAEIERRCPEVAQEALLVFLQLAGLGREIGLGVVQRIEREVFVVVELLLVEQVGPEDNLEVEVGKRAADVLQTLEERPLPPAFQLFARRFVGQAVNAEDGLRHGSLLS